MMFSAVSGRPWARRNRATRSASRGVRGRQLIGLAAIESLVLVGIGGPLGLGLAPLLARAVGYTESFLSFTWREPLPISPTAYNVAMLLAAISATFIARLWPMLRAARTSVISHERRRARAPEKPFWQRFYLDFLLLVPVIYAYRQLSAKGTLVPEALAGEAAQTTTTDPLLFLVPVLFCFALGLLFLRFFPLLTAGWHDGQTLTPTLTVVAFIGAFTALFAATIGVAMGQRGSDVAREAAEVVLGRVDRGLVLDGEGRAMSKSLGNYVGITDPPEEMFGKIMSVSDDLMWDYYAILSDDREWKARKAKVGKNPPRFITA